MRPEGAQARIACTTISTSTQSDSPSSRSIVFAQLVSTVVYRQASKQTWGWEPRGQRGVPRGAATVACAVRAGLRVGANRSYQRWERWADAHVHMCTHTGGRADTDRRTDSGADGAAADWPHRPIGRASMPISWGDGQVAEVRGGASTGLLTWACLQVAGD